MYPHGRSLVKDLAGQPFALVGVNSDDDLEEIRDLVKEENLSWPSFFDGGTSGPIATAWGVRRWPRIFVIDHKGVIRAGDIFGKELDAKVRKLIDEIH